MRIAHVSDCYLPRLGGIERQVSELAQRQQLTGHEVEVITSVGGAAGDGPVRVHRPAPFGDGDIRYRSSHRGAALVAREGYDLVHVHLSTWSPLAFLAARAACRAGIPVAATVHSLWNRMTPVWRAAASTLDWRSWPVAWSAVSAVAASPVSAATGAAPVTIIPNGIDPDEWTLPAHPADPNRVVLASVMRLAPRKRPRQLLHMLSAVRKAVPDSIRLEAVLIGDGPLRSQVEQDALRLGIAGWVTLTGALDPAAIRTLYGDVDLYVAPATLESFGIAALEARAAGLPVVARAGTGVAEFVEHGTDGLLVDGDHGMVDALVRLATRPDVRGWVGAHNRTHRPDVSWSRVLDDCAALYDRAAVLAGRPAPVGVR